VKEVDEDETHFAFDFYFFWGCFGGFFFFLALHKQNINIPNKVQIIM
jgi:hypothetical protein